jgi:hypothetical protein
LIRPLLFEDLLGDILVRVSILRLVREPTACQHASDIEPNKPLEPGDDGAVADDELLKVVRCKAVEDDENAQCGLEREVVKHAIAQLQIMLRRVRGVRT